MARLPKDTLIMTREARSRLVARKTPYWRQIVLGLFVGYVKQKRLNTWVTKRKVADKYVWERLGVADDFMEADGEIVLSYRHAVEAAQKRAIGLRDSRPRYHGDGMTVNAALDSYFEERRLNFGSTTASSDEQRAAHHIRPTLGDCLVSSLTDGQLKEWQRTLANSAPAVRARGVGQRKLIKVDWDSPKVRRQRNQTANRIWTILRAALNHAWMDTHNGIPSRDAWQRVRPLKIEGEGPPRMLDIDEVRRLLNACSPEFRPLVEAGVLTGARYGEITKLKVSDFEIEQRVIRIYQTKTGKTLYQPLTEEGARFFESHTAGRSPESLIFVHRGEKPWGKSEQARPMKEAVERAGLKDVSFKVMRATYGKLLLLATQDIELVAKALGHSDSRITRKHYAQYLPNEVRSAVNKLPTLGISMSNVRRLRK